MQTKSVPVKPGTREKLAPLNKPTHRDEAYSIYMNGNPRNHDSNGNVHESNTRRKEEIAPISSTWKSSTVKTVNPPVEMDASNPYNPKWTKWVLKHHFDVNIESGEDPYHQVKWKVRKVKNMKKSPERQDEKFEGSSPLPSNPKVTSFSNGRSKTHREHDQRKNNQISNENKLANPYYTLADLPLGIEGPFTCNYLIGADYEQPLPRSAVDFDITWLVESFKQSKMANLRFLMMFYKDTQRILDSESRKTSRQPINKGNLVDGKTNHENVIALHVNPFKLLVSTAFNYK